MTQTPPASSGPAADLRDPGKPNSNRSLIMCAAGAVIGLAIAGFGLFTAQGTRTAGLPPEDAALVNNVPILRADLIQQLAAVYNVGLSQATPAQRRKVLADMIREELYVQRGVEMGLPTDDTDVRSVLVQGAEAMLAQDATTARPSEQELRGWYDAHRDKYATEGEMTVHDWLAPGDGAQATSAAQALRQGRTPAELGLKSSGRADDGAEFYFAARIHLGPALFEVARSLDDGQVSEPLVQPDGVHLLQMVHNQPPQPAPFAEVKDRVLQDDVAAKIARLQASEERFLRKRADIKVAADLK